MLDQGKKNIIGILIDAVDYEAALERVFQAAQQHRGLAVSALAVHGVMMGFRDPQHRYRLNSFDLLVPDGQPVRWSLNLLHNTQLPDRVYGPEFMLKVCARAEKEALGIYLYGSTEEVIQALRVSLKRRFPKLTIAGAEPSKFRRISQKEKAQVVARILNSGAGITYVGLGCPRQEVWAYEYREALSMPILAVGAAFDFHAGTLRQAPDWMQDWGLEWLFRLSTEPGRLWRRYVVLGPIFILQVMLQLIRLKEFNTRGLQPSSDLSYG